MKLKLSELASIAEIIGAAAVVVSLLYVGAQVRDNARAVRSAAVNDANTAMQAWYLTVSNNRQVSELWLDGLAGAEDLSVDDEYQFQLVMHAAFLGFQNSFLLAQEGSLDNEIMRSITAALLTTKNLPGMRSYWRQRRGYFHHDFAAYIDKLFAGDASSDAVDVFRDAAAAQKSAEGPPEADTQ
jgi:hypothetical protein